jgi:MFS transporter, putative metabolite:H+ symporter
VTSYQKRLFVFLSVAIFFDGYESFALAQLLPHLRAEFELNATQAGALLSFVNIGALASWAVVRTADRFGRRRVLGITILGYTVASLLTALSPSVELFALSQLVARIFLASEWAISMVVAAEECPAERRGFVIGMMQLCAGAGMIVCAAITPLLLKTSLGWRGVFLVGIVPLLLMAYARRDLRETARFEKVERESKPMGSILAGPYRNRVLELALVWGLTEACLQTASAFRKEFLLRERGWSDGEVGAVMVFAALVALPFSLRAGALLDGLGRRLGAMLAYGCIILGVFCGYMLHDPRALALGMALTMVGANVAIPLLSAYTTERFPTELRADAFAWSCNLLGRASFIAMPLVVGMNAEHWGWGPAVAVTAICPLLALVLIQRRLPETRRLELEETAALKLEGGRRLG